MKAKTPEQKAINFMSVVRTDKPHISNSYLSNLKRALIGDGQFFGSEHYLTFGTEHHKRALEPKEQTTLLEKNDQLCTDMAKAFRADPRVQLIMRGAQFEYDVTVMYRGVLVKVILDILKAPRGWDLKGSACENEKDFFKKSREYDYFRQGALYIDVCGLREFTFIGQCKKDPCKLFFLPVMDHGFYLQEGRDELHKLIDLHIMLRRIKERNESNKK